MSQSNESLARRWFHEVWNHRNVSAIEQMLTSDSLCHTDQGPLFSAEAFRKRVYEPFIGAFPDLEIVVEGTMTAEDQILVRWVAYGTHTGNGLGMPATHRRVTFPGLTWLRVDGERLAEARDCWNVAGLLDALRGGPIPPSITIRDASPPPETGEDACDQDTRLA